MDSAILQATLGAFEALGIHDAGMYRLDEAMDATKSYNKAFIDLSLSYNIMQETWDSFGVVMDKVRQDPKLRTEVAAVLQEEVFTGVDIEGNPNSMVAFMVDYEDRLKRVNKARAEFVEINPWININNGAHIPGTAYNHVSEDFDASAEELSKAIDKNVADIFEASQKGSSNRSIDFENFNSVFEGKIDSNTKI